MGKFSRAIARSALDCLLLPQKRNADLGNLCCVALGSGKAKMKKDAIGLSDNGSSAGHALPRTDVTKYLTPRQVADRWAWHVESVRRAIRQRRIESVIISRRRLVPVAEVERIEAEGRVCRAV